MLGGYALGEGVRSSGSIYEPLCDPWSAAKTGDSKEKEFACGICKLSFATKQNLKRHILVHQGNFLKISIENLLSKIVHNNMISPENVYLCVICVNMKLP